jgi:hypothetical protein
MQQFAKENEGYKYLPTVVHCFSKYAQAISIKNKNADQIIEAF